MGTVNHLHHHRHLQQPESHHTHHGIPISILIVIISVISVAIVLISFLLLLMLCRSKSIKNNESSSKKNNNSNSSSSIRTRDYKLNSLSGIKIDSSPDVKSSCLYGGSLGLIPQSKRRGVQVFTYKELELATGGFSEANLIGHGRFGVVYRGRLSDGTIAAIKMLQMEGKQGEREFRTEVDLMSRLHSPYLVQLLGYCADQHHRLLISELMPNGSLQQHLHPSLKEHQPLNWGTRLRIALDCARALEFLHEHALPSVIHRDFKCSNIVLDHNFRAKVSDLGSAKTGSDKINGQIASRVLGTTGYLAPE